MKPTIDHPEPLYEAIRDDIMTAIREKRLRPGGQIPTELELMEQYKVSRTTVRRAVRDLVENGTLIKRQGFGTFVNAPQYTRHLFSFISFTSDCLNNGLVPSTEVSPVECALPSEGVRSRLDMPDGEKVYKFHRLRFINAEPVMIEWNEVPEHFGFIESETPETLGSLMHVFEKKHGIIAKHYNSILESTYATKQEARMLKTRANAPVIMIEGVCYSTDDKPMYYFKQIISSERCKLDISGSKYPNNGQGLGCSIG